MAISASTDHGIVGNRDLLSRLERDIRAGVLSHAYIIDGSTGSGRHTLARHICTSLACYNRPGRAIAEPEVDPDQMGFFDLEPVAAPAPREASPDAPLPCGECLACRKVIEEKCPDIHVIGREGKATIGAASIRFLRSDVLIPPNDLDTKIYIIEDAEAMTVQAQNALLLTLEEPPPYVLFLLLCNGSDALLETIRSRAPILRTQPIPDEDIRAYMRARKCTLSDEDLSAVILQADGCIGQALTLSDGRAVKPVLKLRTDCDDLLDAAAAKRADGMVTVLYRYLPKKTDAAARSKASSLLSLATLAVRDLLLLRHGEGVRLKYYTDREAAEALAARFTTRYLLALTEALTAAREALEANANLSLTLMQLAAAGSPS